MSYSILVENLAKKYSISHKAKEPYYTLRDTLVNNVKQTIKRTSGLFNGASQETTEEFWALDHVSFEIPVGQSVGIIGRNGAGKSTLLKILSRVTEPTAGKARIRGRLASLLEVGTGFHPELTGRENIFLNGAILGMPKAEIRSKFDEIVAFSGVEKFLDTPVKRYSSGMRVRLAFSVAAHLDQDILIVDEVLSVGDLDFQQKCMGKMESSAKDGRTVVVVSHDLGAIHRLCNRAILLDKGKIVADASTDEVIRAYVANARSAGLEYQQPHKPDKAINLRKVQLLNREGTPSLEFRYDEEFAIAVEYEVNQTVKDCCVWFGLRTIHQAVAFDSADSDVNGTMLNERSPGYYRTEVRIPHSWLNAGQYILIVGITKYSPLMNFDRAEVATFSILDIGTPERTRTGNSRPGILQPYIPWTAPERIDYAE